MRLNKAMGGFLESIVSFEDKRQDQTRYSAMILAAALTYTKHRLHLSIRGITLKSIPASLTINYFEYLVDRSNNL